MLNQYFITLLVTGVTHLLLAAFVFLKNSKKRVNQTYSMYSASIAVWSIFEAFAITAHNKTVALLLWRLNHIGVIFIPVGFVHFVYSLANTTGKKSKVILASYLVAFIFVALNFTNLFILEAVPKFAFRYFINPGQTYYLFFSLWVFLAAFGLIKLFKTYYHFSGVKRNQMRYFCWSMLIAYFGGIPNFFPTFNLEIPILMPFGTYLISIYAVAAAYAIVAHRLMDINVVITRGLAYGTITAIIAGVYIGLMAVADRLFAQMPAYNPTLVHGLLFIAVLFALIYVLPRMKIRALEITRRALFKGKYDYQWELSEATRVIPTMLDLKKLGNYILQKIRETMMIDKLALFVYDEAEKYYHVLTIVGLDENKASQIKIREDSALAVLLRSIGKPLMKEDLEKTGTIPSAEGKLALRHFHSLEAELCVPLLLKGDLVGIMTLGDKSTREMYTNEDISLLSSIANEVTLTIEYIRAVEKLSSEKRYVGLGKAAMRMAHDIKNPLVPIKTILQILPDKYPEQFKQMSEIDPEFTGSFYASALDGVDRINLLIERALHYARHPEPVFSQVKLDRILDEVLIQEAVHLRETKVKLQKRYNSADNNVRADAEQLIELFSNLIDNGIEAMSESPVRILTVKTQTLDGRLVVEITDTGCGIPKDRIDTIFDPFITYKHNGSGLGLAIVKKIVDDHRGSVELNSRPDKGTTFRIVLPKGQ